MSSHEDLTDLQQQALSYRWIESNPVLPSSDDETADVLTAKQVEQWRVNGYCLVDGLYSDELISGARKELETAFRPPISVTDGNELSRTQDFGSDDLLGFPCPAAPVCDKIPFEPRALKAVSQLLRIPRDDVRLIQAVPWAKYGSTKIRDNQFNQDQRLHCDYPNNTLVTPPNWYNPEAVAAILYYGDVEDSLGPTALVARQGDTDPGYKQHLQYTTGVAGKRFFNNRIDHENYLKEHHPDAFQFRHPLYEREAKVRFRRGTMLFYRHDAWHRGTPILPGAVRYAHNLAWKRAGFEWVTQWNTGWAKNMYQLPQDFEKWMAKASVRERTCLGFPKPGDPYWNEETLLSVEQRYKAWGFDITPYKSAFCAKFQTQCDKV